MMSKMLMYVMAVTMIVVISSGNPIKMTMGLMLTSLAMMSQMSIEASNAWFPSIFFLMFMSGILVMFMILSAILPNEKTMKMKKSLMLIIMISASYLTFSLAKWNFNISETSSFLEEKSNLMLMMLMLLVYFLMFVKVLSSENSSIKSSKLCLMYSNFVNS